MAREAIPVCCVGLGLCGIIVSWILGIAVFSWMVNIRNAERWIKPYRVYDKMVWRDLSP